MAHDYLVDACPTSMAVDLTYRVIASLLIGIEARAGYRLRPV